MSGHPPVAGVRHRTVATNGIEMHVAEAGEPGGTPIVLCHGFPELWYSWRHQIPVLAEAGHHVVVPDQRGYGATTAPSEITDYDIVHLTDDLLGLLDDLGHERAVFVGHDWGAMLVWQLAQLHPERVAAVVGMSVPFSPRGSSSLIEVLRAVVGDNFFYILHFQEPGKADADLGKDPRDAMRRFFGGATVREGGGGSMLTARPAATTTFWDWLPPVDQLPSWISEEEFEVFASTFERTGFTGGINWYRNMHRNWEITPHLADVKITMPSLFVAGSADPVLQLADPSNMAGWLTDLRGTVLVPGAGHWVQQETPGPVNEALLGFLASLG